MKLENQNSNVFVQQMSKLFGDLSHRTPNLQQPASPRMTCTRLRRFRETKQDLVLESDFGSDNRLTQTGNELGEPDNKDEPNNKKESFADWVVRNQQAHKALADKQNPCREEIKNNNNIANETVQGFAHFSSSTLQEVAKNPNTPVVTLKWLAAHYDVEVREALAINESIGSDILHILVRDGEDSVKKAVLDNKNISQKELLRLCGEDNPLIAEKAKNMLHQKHNQKSKPEINHRRAMAVTSNIDISTARSIRRKRK